MQEVYLIRHGETEWSRSGRHTGNTDVPLTENGRKAARLLAPALAGKSFALVLTSPMERACQTCELAGLGDRARIDLDLKEWDYGDYEGLTPREIHRQAPGWLIFTDGCPGGESPDAVVARIDRVLARVQAAGGNVALFAHGHLLRSLAARWLGLRVAEGRLFLLDPSTLSVLTYYRSGVPSVKRWNVPLVPRPKSSLPSEKMTARVLAPTAAISGGQLP
jgi:probable phosphoglycerate mutase